jgi:hypothetical protein
VQFRLSRPSVLRLAPALAFAGALAACADGPLAPAGVPAVPQLPTGPAAAGELTCRAEVATRELTCSGAALGEGVRADWLLNRSNADVRLVSANVAYDSVTEVYSADVTLQNLRLERIGTDGARAPGSRAFFFMGPFTTSGTGQVEVRNPDGVGVFTAGGQPYFLFPEVLASGETSAPRRWEWSVPRTVGTFVFRVALSAPVMPIVVFDFPSAAGGRDVFRVALDGSDLVPVTADPAEDLDATVAKGTVVFTSYRSGNADLWSAPLAGGAATRLTSTAAASEQNPALSRDGARLAYTSNASGGVSKLWTANPDGSGAARATTGWGFSGSIEAHPSWADTGNRLVFTATTFGSADLFDATLPGAFTLATAGARTAEVEPAWSADGRWVAFASTRAEGGDTELYLLRLATGEVTRLTTRVGIDTSPAWTSDGRIVYVAYVSNQPRLYWLDPADPTVTYPIPLGPGNPLRPAVVPF